MTPLEEKIYIFQDFWNAIKPLNQVFFYEYCKLFKSTYFEEHLWTAAFALTLTKAAFQRRSYKKVFWKYAANL